MEDNNNDEKSTDDTTKAYSNFEIQNLINNNLNFNNIFNNSNPQLGNRNDFNNNLNNINNINSINNINFFKNNINSQIILFLANQFLEFKGWSLFDKFGNKINDFNSFELFDYLIENILGNNIDLDNYKILAQGTENYYKGGNLILSLFDILPQILSKKKDEFNNQIISSLYNNFGFYNDFGINLGNNINFPYNTNLNNNINLNNLNLNNLNYNNSMNILNNNNLMNNISI